MKKVIVGKAGTNSSGKEAIMAIGIEGTLRPEMTAREEGLEITEAIAGETNSVLLKRG